MIPLTLVPDGGQLLLRDIAKIKRENMPEEYDRLNQLRYVSLTANIEGEDLGRVSRHLTEAIEAAKLYQVTEKRLEALKYDTGFKATVYETIGLGRPEGVPKPVLDKLTALKDRQFSKEADFVAALANVLTPEEMTAYKDKIVAGCAGPPRGVQVELRGQVLPMKQMFTGLASGLALAVVMVGLMLTAYFQSVRLAIVAVGTAPLVIAGVALALYFTNTTLNIESFMGAIMAIGVAVANAILLVTFAERNRQTGMTSAEAAITGASERLRPILMTSCAMIAGMVPMALGFGEGGEQTASLGRAVIGGLLAATFGTTMILPHVFAIVLGKSKSPRPSTRTTRTARTTTPPAGPRPPTPTGSGDTGRPTTTGRRTAGRRPGPMPRRPTHPPRGPERTDFCGNQCRFRVQWRDDLRPGPARESDNRASPSSRSGRLLAHPHGSAMTATPSHPARKRSRRWWLLLGVAVAAGGLVPVVSGCGHEKAKAKPDDTLAVSVVQPTRQTFRRWIVQPGVVESYETTPIYTKLAGYLEDVRVDIGDKLKKDELLCKVWVPEIEEAVLVKQAKVTEGEAMVIRMERVFKAAQANVKTSTENVQVAVASVIRAVAQEKRWRDELERDRKIQFFDKKVIAETEHQYMASSSAHKEADANVDAAKASLAESQARARQAEVDVDVAKANLAVWRAELREEQAWLSYSKITAPYDGVVTRRYIHTGHFVQPTNSGTTSKSAEPLFTVMRTDKMRVVIEVPEMDSPLVKDGADAIVSLQAYRGEDVKCKVEQTSWSLDTDIRTLRVEIFLTNPCDQLRPGELIQDGMYANVKIAADVPNVMTAPAEAILTDGNQRYCFLMQDGKARRVNLRLGATNDRVTELMAKQVVSEKTGQGTKWVKFDGTEQIITSNLKSIQDGQAVKEK
jgi:RND family efflux transporter MFP subunit